jgi:hypothetical protein
MNLQHVQVKVFAGPESMPDLGGAIPVFHRWIQQRAFDELLIDVADYRHVPYGPGVVLVGHEAFRSLDEAQPGLGLLYSRRTAVDGSSREKLQQAFEAALATCARLESEPEFSGKLAFDLRNIQVSVNDRLLVPNRRLLGRHRTRTARRLRGIRIGAPATAVRCSQPLRSIRPSFSIR